LMID